MNSLGSSDNGDVESALPWKNSAGFLELHNTAVHVDDLKRYRRV